MHKNLMRTTCYSKKKKNLYRKKKKLYRKKKKTMHKIIIHNWTEMA